jgi:hypothetical protein
MQKVSVVGVERCSRGNTCEIKVLPALFHGVNISHRQAIKLAYFRYIPKNLNLQ